jgi:hypothetical protein
VRAFRVLGGDLNRLSPLAIRDREDRCGSHGVDYVRGGTRGKRSLHEIIDITHDKVIGWPRLYPAGQQDPAAHQRP